MLTVDQVTKMYKKEAACNQVSFTINDGEITVLLGPNGAGKSTIMKCITGFLKYSGTIDVEGYSNKTVDAKRYLGYMPEIPSLYPTLTVKDHMEFVARAYRLKDYKERIDELLTRFQLDDKKKKFGDELSKGMQQKLSLCCALLPQPKILLMDEQMIGLDPHAIKEVNTMMKEMRNSGNSLLISTHIIDSIGDMWDRAIIMQHGNVCYNVTRSELERDGVTLEEKFFEVTEGLTHEDMRVDEQKAEAEVK